jgi:hypothetical protein
MPFEGGMDLVLFAPADEAFTRQAHRRSMELADGSADFRAHRNPRYYSENCTTAKPEVADPKSRDRPDEKRNAKKDRYACMDPCLRILLECANE